MKHLFWLTLALTCACETSANVPFYVTGDEPVRYVEAQAVCEDLGGTLAGVDPMTHQEVYNAFVALGNDGTEALWVNNVIVTPWNEVYAFVMLRGGALVPQPEFGDALAVPVCVVNN